MLDVQNVSLSYGAREVLKNATFKIEDGRRAAIIGPNGMGKSTLLRIVAGELKAESGSVVYPKKSEVGYLPQHLDMNSPLAVEEECRSVFNEVLEHESEMRELEHRMGEVPHGTPEFDEIADRYEYLMHELERRDVYTMDATIGRVLDGLGFKPKDKVRACREFSGGWQMRIALAKLLLRNPDILLLDEPTNHLDIETIEWLGEWISGHEGSVLMVSHERSFMDKLVTKVVEIDRGDCFIYNGNYSDSLEQRAERREMALRTYKNQQQQMAHVQRFIDRFRYQASKAALVQSRIKMLDKIDKVDAPSDDQKTIEFRFPPAPRSGKEVILAKGVSKTFGPNRVLRDVELTILRGEKVALVGVNGAGKTTLMRVLAGKMPPDEQGKAKIQFGGNVEMAYFAQYDHEDLHPSNTILDEFSSSAPLEVTSQARDILGAFLFSGEDVEKKVAVLSGGERTRLRLAKMLCGKANLLLLDEPTNHLDLGSRLTLEEALRQYEGSVLLVSHDRYFLDAVTTRVVAIEDGQVVNYPGNYSEYLEARARREALALAAASAPPPRKEKPEEKKPAAAVEREKESYEQRRAREMDRRKVEAEVKRKRERLAELEKLMASLDKEVQGIEVQLTDPKILADRKRLAELTKLVEADKGRKDEAEEEWLELGEEVANLEKLLEG